MRCCDVVLEASPFAAWAIDTVMGVNEPPSEGRTPITNADVT